MHIMNSLQHKQTKGRSLGCTANEEISKPLWIKCLFLAPSEIAAPS